MVGTAMRDLVGIEVGDTVTLTVRDPRSDGDLARVQTSIAGFVRETLGTSAYTSRADLAATVGAPVPATGALLAYEDDVAPDVMRDRIEGLTDVAAYRSSDAIRELIEDVTGLLVGFITIMLVCGGALAATMIFTTVSVSIAERTNEVATLRASGVSVRTVARLVTMENLVVALLGIVPGLVLGVLGGRLMMATYTTDQFSFDFIVSPLSLAASVGAILLVAVASQLPGLRSLARLDLARTVRERAA
ncbi:MAG: ABC transporter permease [Actinomycetota bacterium]